MRREKVNKNEAPPPRTAGALHSVEMPGVEPGSERTYSPGVYDV